MDDQKTANTTPFGTNTTNPGDPVPPVISDQATIANPTNTTNTTNPINMASAGDPIPPVIADVPPPPPPAESENVTGQVTTDDKVITGNVQSQITPPSLDTTDGQGNDKSTMENPVPPVISDVPPPPIPSADETVPPVTSGLPQMADAQAVPPPPMGSVPGDAGNSGTPPVVAAGGKQPKKKGKAGIVLGVLGAFVLAGGLGVGSFLVSRQTVFQERAQQTTTDQTSCEPGETCRSGGAPGPNGKYGCAGWDEESTGKSCSTVAQGTCCTKGNPSPTTKPGGGNPSPTKIPGGANPTEPPTQPDSCGTLCYDPAWGTDARECNNGLVCAPPTDATERRYCWGDQCGGGGGGGGGPTPTDVPSGRAQCVQVQVLKDGAEVDRVNVGDTVTFKGFGKTKVVGDEIDRIEFTIKRKGDVIEKKVKDTTKEGNKYVAQMHIVVDKPGNYSATIRVHSKKKGWID